MRAEIVTIGDEILIGQTVDTNSAWMGQQLNAIGIHVGQITSISDEAHHIKDTLDEVLGRADLILMTGGLGPTQDDITKSTLAEYFETDLVMQEEVLHKIEEYFESRGREILEVNRQQAALPANCTVLANPVGTASGMWFERDGKIVVSMPGVPYEMKHLVSKEVIPKVVSYFDLPAIVHQTVLTLGVGESFLAEIIKDWEQSLDAEEIKIAYLPSPGIVKIRLTAVGPEKSVLVEKVSRKKAELLELIPEHVFGFDKDRLEEIVGRLLLEQGASVGTAESCTGGYIAHLLTSIAGSSSYFLGSVVSYANEVKQNQLNVDPESIAKYGAVSQSVVEQMASNACKVLSVDYAIATSGVAGPDGGSEEKPVGTVWVAVAGPKGVVSKKYLFEKNRERNIRRAALAGLNMLRKELVKS